VIANPSDILFQRLADSASLNVELKRHLVRLKPCCLRHQFSLSAVDLALEHHQAIGRLFKKGLYGSGTALARSLAEATTAAYWFNYIASDEEVAQLPTDPMSEAEKVDVATLTAVAEKLIPLFPPMSGIRSALQSRGPDSLRWLHKYSHGGTPQLLRRPLTFGWTEVDVHHKLLLADLLATGAVQSTIVFRPDQSLDAALVGKKQALDAWRVMYFGGQPAQDEGALPQSEQRCHGDPV
jgi:hypothetical protein